MSAQWISFNLVLLAAIASPGPALLHAVRITLVNGRQAGIYAGMGLACMATLWTLLALWGLNRFFTAVPAAYMALKVAGALYLILIAWRTWRNARLPVTEHQTPPRSTSSTTAFLSGVMINLANPKSVLFAGSVLLVIFPASMSVGQQALVATNHLLVELLFYSMLVAVLGTSKARLRYLQTKAVLDRIAAVVLGTLGIRLLLDRSQTSL